MPDPGPGNERECVNEVDLTALVPPNAITVRVSYRIEPPEAAAILYSTRHDSSPVWLRGPEGEVIIRIVEPQRIYFETIGSETRLHLKVAGYQHSEGQPS